MSDEKEAVTDDSDCDDCIDDEEDTKLVHKHKTAGDLLHEFWKTSSLQGLPRVFTETIRFWKFFWFALFLLLLAGCMYQMWSIFENYYSYETATSVNMGYGKMPLPSITICNVNPIRESKLLAHEDSADIITTYRDIVDHKHGQGNDSKSMTSKTYQFYGWMQDFISDISPQQRIEMGHQINPMVQYCYLHEHSCNRNNFTHSLSTEFGNCFTFNSAKSKYHNDGSIQVTTTGLKGGFGMMLFAEQKEYLRSYSYAHSFRLDLHGYNTMCLVEKHPIAIATGTETFIKLKLVKISRLEPPFGKCDNEYAKTFEDLYGYKYNVQTCNATCPYYKLAEECGCMYQRDFKYYTEEQKSRQLPKCDENRTSSMYNCSEDIMHNEFTDGCSCPLPCSELKYDYQITTNAYGTEDVFDELMDLVCYYENSTSPDSNCAWLNSTHPAKRQEVLRNNFAFVRIYFEDLLYDELEERPTYEWSQFLADFGGNVGLWIGASIFTILEIVELLTKMCVSKMERKNRGIMKRIFKDSRKKKNKSENGKIEVPLHEKEILA